MTVIRKMQAPVVSADVADDEMNGAYAVDLHVHLGYLDDGRLRLDAAEAGQLAAELRDASAEAINKYREDHPAADPFDAATGVSA